MKNQIAVILLVTISLSMFAQVNTQWRGLNRDGIYNNENLLKVWPEEGPELLWYNDSLPTGYSSPTIGDEFIYLSGLADTMDYLIALNQEGMEQWRKPIGEGWTESYSDSRSTPTLVDDKIYVQSGTGDVACFDASSGELIWSRDVHQEFGGVTGTWGYSESLLVEDEKVFMSLGGNETTMVALNALDGQLVWKSESLQDTGAYVSPILVEENGRKIAINLLSNNLFGVDIATGEILFSANYSEVDAKRAYALWNSSSASRINTNNPVYKDHAIYLTSGYNHSGVMYQLSDDLSQATLVWVDSVLDVHFGGVVLIDGFIYGSNWINNSNGNWCCVNWETGECMYEEKWHNKGNIIYADGLLYIYEEKRGHIGIVKPNPEKFEVISSFKVPYGRGPHWGHPVIKNGLLYIRHGAALMAYDISAH